MRKKTNNNSVDETLEELDNICEFCKKKHETVNQNLILTVSNHANLVESQKRCFLFRSYCQLAMSSFLSSQMKQKE